jgi:hypothetical protein
MPLSIAQAPDAFLFFLSRQGIGNEAIVSAVHDLYPVAGGGLTFDQEISRGNRELRRYD